MNKYDQRCRYLLSRWHSSQDEMASVRLEEYQRRTRPRHQHPRKGPRSAEARPRDYLGRCSEGRAGLETGRRLGVWMLAGGGGRREGMVGRHIPTRVLSAPEGVMRLRCGYLPPSSPKPLLITNPCYTDMPTNLILFISFRFVTKRPPYSPYLVRRFVINALQIPYDAQLNWFIQILLPKRNGCYVQD